ncbi:MAG: AAC(3) family N-acetyltransferase [Lachnospiraceae bacterium]|jgi:aminoglycoside 3-N-acetyltransferase|nr:AAC(3) family N-acetyltransferase [Lachnospiraceae bacterium]
MTGEYISYEKIAQVIGIKPGDIVYLSSDILPLAWTAKLHGECFNIDRLIDSFQEQVTLKGTLLIPAFHFSFSNTGFFDYCKTPSAAGALGNAALKRADFKRTSHPMHSFCVWGKDKGMLCALQNKNSFGEDSPFAYMHEKDAIQVMLGTDYQRSMTFVHYVENRAGVPYRFQKEFTGTYVDGDGISETRTYPYPARYLELGSMERFNRIGRKLEGLGKAESKDINGIPVKKVMLAESYQLIYEDIKYNMCRNLYDFNREREAIWGSYGSRGERENGKRDKE